MDTQEQVASILVGWAVTTCAHHGSFWTIGGLDPYGRAHSGSRADAIELAHDLARLVEPPPVLAPVEPAPIMATADPEPYPPAAQAIQPDLAPPASAGVEEAPPTSAPAAPAYPGTMLREDRENFLRGQITVRATRIEQNRLQGRFDVNAQERQRWGFTTYHNLSDLGQPIPDDVQAAHEEFLQADGWIRATKAHADNLRAAAISVPLDMLEAMQDQIEEGWP